MRTLELVRYGLLFLILSISVLGLGVLVGGPGHVLAWPAVSFGVVGGAYLLNRPTLLGKRPHGTLAPWAWVLLGPYLGFCLAIWRLEGWLSREEAMTEIIPGLWVGRRPRSADIPPSIRRIVDLTAEFDAERAIRESPGYLALPILDGSAPHSMALRSLVDGLRGEEPTLLHCASGHGRSALVAAVVLLVRGIARDANDAEAIVRGRRPGVRLNAIQRLRLRDFAKDWGGQESTR